MLAELLEKEIARRGLSVREAARQIGLTSHSQIYHVLKGNPIEVSTAYKITQWLGVPLTAAVEEAGGNEALMSSIMAILNSSPELASVFNHASQLVTEGVLTPDDFEDIIEYAAFKISKKEQQSQKR